MEFNDVYENFAARYNGESLSVMDYWNAETKTAEAKTAAETTGAEKDGNSEGNSVETQIEEIEEIAEIAEMALDSPPKTLLTSMRSPGPADVGKTAKTKVAQPLLKFFPKTFLKTGGSPTDLSKASPTDSMATTAATESESIQTVGWSTTQPLQTLDRTENQRAVLLIFFCCFF